MALEHRSGAVETPCPAGAPAEIHYSPAEDLERVDVALLREAAKQIDMAAYVLTGRAVVEALREAAERGVRVRIWRDASEAARLSDYDVEAQLGGRVQGIEIRSNSPGGELMHLKGYCVDHRLLRTGSANFNRSGETRQDNDPRGVASRECLRRLRGQIRSGLGEELRMGRGSLERTSARRIFQYGFSPRTRDLWVLLTTISSLSSGKVVLL